MNSSFSFIINGLSSGFRVSFLVGASEPGFFTPLGGVNFLGVFVVVLDAGDFRGGFFATALESFSSLTSLISTTLPSLGLSFDALKASWCLFELV